MWRSSSLAGLRTRVTAKPWRTYVHLMAFANTSSEVFSAGAGLFQSSKKARRLLTASQFTCVDVRFQTKSERSKSKEMCTVYKCLEYVYNLYTDVNAKTCRLWHQFLIASTGFTINLNNEHGHRTPMSCAISICSHQSLLRSFWLLAIFGKFSKVHHTVDASEIGAHHSRFL